MCYISLNPPIKHVPSIHTEHMRFDILSIPLRIRHTCRNSSHFAKAIAGLYPADPIDSYCCVNHTAWAFEWHVTNIQETQTKSEVGREKTNECFNLANSWQKFAKSKEGKNDPAYRENCRIKKCGGALNSIPVMMVRAVNVRMPFLRTLESSSLHFYLKLQLLLESSP
jgi:hypothetical protein